MTDRDEIERKHSRRIRFESKRDADLPGAHGVRLTTATGEMPVELLNDTILERLDRLEALVFGKSRRNRRG